MELYDEKDPDRPNLFYLFEYRGKGTVYNMFGSQILSDRARGIDNPDAQIVRLNRTR